MKYLQNSFQAGGYGKKYSDNWDSCFGNREREEESKYCIECDYYRTKIGLEKCLICGRDFREE